MLFKMHHPFPTPNKHARLKEQQPTVLSESCATEGVVVSAHQPCATTRKYSKFVSLAEVLSMLLMSSQGRGCLCRDSLRYCRRENWDPGDFHSGCSCHGITRDVSVTEFARTTCLVPCSHHAASNSGHLIVAALLPACRRSPACWSTCHWFPRGYASNVDGNGLLGRISWTSCTRGTCARLAGVDYALPGSDRSRI